MRCETCGQEYADTLDDCPFCSIDEVSISLSNRRRRQQVVYHHADREADSHTCYPLFNDPYPIARSVSVALRFRFAIIAIAAINLIASPMTSKMSQIVVVSIIGILGPLMTLIATVLFLIWVYHANKNLDVISKAKKCFTPIWSVVCWLIPIVNLYRPFQIINEIWKHSKAGITAGEAGISENAHRQTIPLWWILTLAGEALPVLTIIAIFMRKPNGIGVIPTLIFLLAAMAGIALQLRIVRHVSRWQATQWNAQQFQKTDDTDFNIV